MTYFCSVGQFKAAQKADAPVLYHLKGKRHIRMHSMPLKASLMNHDDSYIVNSHKVIFVWFGASSNRIERAKALAAAIDIKDKEEAGRAVLVKIEGPKSSRAHFPSKDERQLFELLQGSVDDVQTAETAEDDVAFEARCDERVTLYVSGDTLAVVAQGKSLKVHSM